MERRRNNETQREREARVGAKMLLRAYDREAGGFTVEDLFHRIGFCRWQAERIRLHDSSVAAWEIDCYHRNLQEKLYVIELALKRFLPNANNPIGEDNEINGIQDAQASR